MAQIQREMHQHPPQSAINLNAILFALFKRKGTVLLCAAVGIAASAAFYFMSPRFVRIPSQAAGTLCYGKKRSGPD